MDSKACASKVEQIAAGSSPIVEAGLGEALTDGVADDLITAQSQKIEALKKYKKGLMQQLFPVLDEVSA